MPWAGSAPCHTSGIPASPSLILPEAAAVSTTHAFKASWSLRHPVRDVSPIHWTDYTRDSERGHAEGVPKVFRRSISFHGYICNLEMFSF